MYCRDQYQSSIDHAEDLSDPALGLDLDCIRSNIILNTDDGSLPMVPVFANTYGMLVNNDLFEKEGLSVPKTYQELVDVCNAFREKGYENPMMGFSKEETTSVFTLTAYPFFCETVANDAEAVKKLNALDASAGEYMRPTLEKMEQFLNDRCVDPDACAKIEDNYEAVILRFFEGDVPMMTCSGDTVSGTKKRESRSEAFIANPFTYTFVPVPMSDEGANFLDMPNLQFSVNKDSQNLDMANEFMRFLITQQELNNMAQNKGLMSPTKDLSFNSVYAAFGEVPESRILSPEVIGLTDDAVIQLRQAVYGVCTGSMTIDEAIGKYGTFANKKLRRKRIMEKKEVFVDISARHVHLTREDQDVLFGKGYELEVYKELAGGGGFASAEKIAVVGPRGSFPKVRILGPCRRQSQVELSKTDARALGVDAPVRISGDLEGTPGIKLVGPAGELELKQGVIVAKRHIHIGKKQVEEWGLSTGDIVAVRVDTPDRSLIFGDTEIRVQDEEDLALMHIDTDEANAAGMGPMKAYIVEF